MSQNSHTIQEDNSEKDWTYKNNPELRELLDLIAILLAAEYVKIMEANSNKQLNGGDSTLNPSIRLRE